MTSFKVNQFQNSSWKKFEDFYSCGTRIRKRNSNIEFNLWKDNRNLHFVTKNNNFSKCKFWIISDGTNECRTGAYIPVNTTAGYIGWYECDNNKELNHELFRNVLEWFLENKCDHIIGPINGSTWYDYRFNLTSSTPIFHGEPFQPLYYVDYWKAEGFVPSIQYLSSFSLFPDLTEINFKMARKHLETMNLLIEPLSPDVYIKYQKNLHLFLNDTFKKNPFFSSIDEREFEFIHKELPDFLNPEFSFIILNSNSFPIGLFISYPENTHPLNTNSKSSNKIFQGPKLIIKTVALHPEWQNRQIGSMMIKLLYNIAKKNNMSYVIHALMYHKNISALVGNEKFDAIPSRIYSLFEKSL